MNVYVPFVCLALGAVINWRGLPATVLKVFDLLTNAALMVLMVVIGLNIGTSPQVMDNLGSIGLRCLLISFCSIVCSVALVRIAEEAVMPLEKIRLQLAAEKNLPSGDGSSSGFSPLVILMPSFIVLGILAGRFIVPDVSHNILDRILTVSLIFLYTGVGVSLGSNKAVFQYIRRLGARILIMPAAIFSGCLIAGFACGILLDVPASWSVIASSGMGYYSLTGAFLTEAAGIEAGTYGFIVNVSRDVFTVALLPLTSKISKGSPVASGAAGCMDTMLVPVTKAVGPELGMVALISGTILTFVVPVWLPVAQMIFGL